MNKEHDLNKMNFNKLERVLYDNHKIMYYWQPNYWDKKTEIIDFYSGKIVDKLDGIVLKDSNATKNYKKWLINKIKELENENN